MDPFVLLGLIRMAGLVSVVPSSRVGNVTSLILFCGSLLDPGHGCWILLLIHCAEHISETKSYTRFSNEGALNVATLVGWLVWVDSAEGVDVLIGANITFTCTHI